LGHSQSQGLGGSSDGGLKPRLLVVTFFKNRDIFVDIYRLLLKIKPLEYNTKMGIRAKKIFKAANNVSVLLSENDKKLYLNLRVEL
jgi:hypothetical protein